MEEYFDSYQSFITEGKQVGLLYHFTSFKAFKSILRDGFLNASYDPETDKPNISFTRDKNFWKIPHSIGTIISCGLILDGDKMSHKYKIRPFQWNPVENIADDEWVDGVPPDEDPNWRNHYDEKEERISFKKRGDKLPLKKYLKGVMILKSKRTPSSRLMDKEFIEEVKATLKKDFPKAKLEIL